MYIYTDFEYIKQNSRSVYLYIHNESFYTERVDISLKNIIHLHVIISSKHLTFNNLKFSDIPE